MESVVITSKERFIEALNGEVQERPPVWLMRQAGRYLPEFREIREKHGFLKMVRTPEIACEITLQPLRRYAFDGAILFSDILVTAEALGQPYEVVKGRGIVMDYAMDEAGIAKIEPGSVREKLDYVVQALGLLKKELKDERALLGFAGSPWTLACYMVEGGSSATFAKAKAFAYENPKAFNRLLETLSDAIAEYLLMQIESGVDMVQIFDSCAAQCIGSDYWEMSLRWIKHIVDRLPEGFPVMLFAKGVGHRVEDLLRTGASGLSMDWSVELEGVRKAYPGKYILQGNLDPAVLQTTPEVTRAKTLEILERMDGQGGHVFNLGHGVTPEVKVECVESVVDTVVNYRGKAWR